MTKQQRNLYLAKWRDKNRLKIRRLSSEWYYRNRDNSELKKKRKLWWKNWYKKNKKKKLIKGRLWRTNNIDKLRESKKIWRLKNREKIKKSRIGELERYPNLKIATYLRSRLRCALKGGYKKGGGLVELLGVSIPRLKVYLEGLFTEGMSWDNYGKWHIDHIKPISKFNLSNISGQKMAMNYKNLQPLWATDNLRKGKKIS